MWLFGNPAVSSDLFLICFCLASVLQWCMLWLMWHGWSFFIFSSPRFRALKNLFGVSKHPDCGKVAGIYELLLRQYSESGMSNLPVYLPVYMPVYLPVYLPCLPACPPACLPACLLACLPSCLPYLPVYLPVYLPASLPVCLSAYLTVRFANKIRT